jgi:DNA-nicking Smr family endonuclease
MTSRRRSRTPSDDETALWRRATQGDKPLGRTASLPSETPRPRLATPRTEESSPIEAPLSGSRSLDAATDTRLRRGRLPIEGTIDLHGMTLIEAEDKLARYIEGAYRRGKRCLLVVTGKGAPPPAPHERDYMPERPRPGAIRAAFPQWMREGRAAPFVLSFHPAQPQHGGGGAFYLLLRRRRGE